jgi:hypothetical protein
MIRCKPKGLCSWDFLLEGEGHQASLSFNWFSEQGTVIADEVPFEVRKHGVLSGHWTLEQDRTPVVSAQKSSAFTRTFEIQNARATLVLCAESAFGRSFRVEHSREVIAALRPDHSFTRRATIETFGRQLDFPMLCFAFWLVVLTWRRAASSQS